MMALRFDHTMVDREYQDDEGPGTLVEFHRGRDCAVAGFVLLQGGSLYVMAKTGRRKVTTTTTAAVGPWSPPTTREIWESEEAPPRRRRR